MDILIEFNRNYYFLLLRSTYTLAFNKVVLYLVYIIIID